MKIWTRNNCVPCVRLKQWLAEAKRDNKYKSDIHTFLHSVEFINIDEVPEEIGKDYLFGLGIKSVPCLIIEYMGDTYPHIGYEPIIEVLERCISQRGGI